LADKERTESGFVLYSDMDVRQQKSYQELRSAIDIAAGNKANLLIVTLPGTGMGRFLREYEAEKGGKLNVEILNYDWEKTEEALKVIDEKMKTLAADKKIVLTINYPGLLEDKRLTGRSWWNHFYQRYYFGVRNEADGLMALDEIKPEIAKEEAKKIYGLSGGLAQIMKYLALNGSDAREGLEAVVNPIIKAILETNEEIRQKLGIKTGGTVLEEYLKGRDWPIKIDFELNIVENGQKGERLTPVEGKILTKMMNNEGKMTKEEVSDIKWGEGKYDEYSDQAVNKTMRRLSEKLGRLAIETVPKIGYLLRIKDGRKQN
jgi:hypothetical protein